jgi:AcrR family transcriptional regulator
MAKEKDISKKAEIKEAALRLFTKLGYSAVTSRDIAKEAGVNHALLNYYFTSKEKLFEIIVEEIRMEFIPKVILILNDPGTTIEKKIEDVINFYYDRDLVKSPDVPFFMLSHLRENSEMLQHKFGDLYFMKQVKSAIKRGEIDPINPVNLMLNITSLIIFPLIIRPRLQQIGSINDQEFDTLMEERKKKVLKWILDMMKSK